MNQESTRRKPSSRAEGMPVMVILTVAFLAFLLIHWYVPAGLVAILWLFSFNFFRDPERKISPDPKAIVSPADGQVVEITEVEEPEFRGEKSRMVAIFLNVFDVHVNRSPVAGDIMVMKHTHGKFLNAMNPECSKCNENQLIGIEANGCRITVKQIAGLIARRIIGWVMVGDNVEKGQRIGMIKFGSRTEIFMPLDTEISVKIGEHVKGGETVIGYRK